MEKRHRNPLRFIALFAIVAAVAALSSCRLDLLLPLISGETSSATDTDTSAQTVASETETETASETETETEYIQTEPPETETVTSAPVVTYERLTVLEEILPYGIDYIYDDAMYDDERITVSDGKDGYLYGVWTVTLEDGAEISRERTGELRTEPVARVVKTGTVPAYAAVYESETAEKGYYVSVEYSGELYDDESYVKTKGINGEIKYTYEITLYHGSETGRRLFSSEVTKEPVAEIVVRGTKKRIVTGTLSFPVPSEYANASCVSSWFGPRNLSISPYHYGIDFAVPQGTPVYAADGGVVLEAYTAEQVAGTSSWSYGTFILLQHVSENGAINMRTIYAHLSKLAVKAGDTVTKGQIIGYSGATGNVTGPHLHFELRLPVNGIYVSQKVNATDPKDYLPW